jgi:hypothetical protein
MAALGGQVAGEVTCPIEDRLLFRPQAVSELCAKTITTRQQPPTGV